jgi:hypothetical protein
MAQDNSSVKQAPYMSYGVFTKSIETLAGTTVPSGPLDRRVLSGLSGNDYGALIPGLRFLGLIDDERKATSQYRELVEAWNDKPKFQKLLLAIFQDKYAPILGKVNLKQGTSAELEKAFKDYGVPTGQMLTKTIRFFIKAVTEAGVALSPHITARKPRIPNTTPKKSSSEKSTRAKQQKDSPDNGDEIPGGFERMPLPGVPNSFVQYPVNLTEAHCQILDGIVGVLRTSVKARTGGKDTKP